MSKNSTHYRDFDEHEIDVLSLWSLLPSSQAGSGFQHLVSGCSWRSRILRSVTPLIFKAFVSGHSWCSDPSYLDGSGVHLRTLRPRMLLAFGSFVFRSYGLQTPRLGRFWTSDPPSLDWLLGHNEIEYGHTVSYILLITPVHP